ncbi:MAG: LysM peptidoglycan-binding domain-containing protein [Acidimicrobiales bacterium]
MQATQKAYIEVENGQRLTCLFNPSELTIAKSNLWESDNVPGRNAPDLFFTGGESGTMDLSLVFDTTADGSPVTKHTNKLMDVMKVDPNLPGHDPERNKGRPPWVKFHWGDLHSFKAIVTSLNLTFTYFSSSGVPLRAKASISLKQFQEDAKWGPQNPTSGTPDPHRVHQLERGETLDRLAAAYYGDSTKWRHIARANGVEDPLRLQPGTRLVIPKLKGGDGA